MTEAIDPVTGLKVDGDYFPWTGGPLVTVMIPSRGRPLELAASLDSLISLAYRTSWLEFLIKADEDDPVTHAVVGKLQRLFPQLSLQMEVSPRGNGYRDIHTWYNRMAQRARGDWLLVFNDDARMRTQDWDMVLGSTVLPTTHWHGVHDICCLVPAIPDMRPETGAFFFLRRSVVKLLGRLSPIPHCDTWVLGLMKCVDSCYGFPFIEVIHEEARDRIFDEGNAVRMTTEYTIHSQDALMEKLGDAVKLGGYLAPRRRTQPRYS